MKLKKATKIEKERFYRKDKRYPKRADVRIAFDTGVSEKVISLRFPETEQIKETEHEMKHNPSLWQLWFGGIKIVYYLNTDKGFIYDCDGNFCGTFDKYDLKRAFTRIGTFLKTVKR